MVTKFQLFYFLFGGLLWLTCWSGRPEPATVAALPVFIKDYIHIPEPHPIFRQVDSLCYRRAYTAACRSYEALLPIADNLRLADQAYLYNQLTYLYLKTHRFEEAHLLLDQSAQHTIQNDTTYADQAFNRGALLLQGEESGKGVWLLRHADRTYNQIYGSHHRKRLELLLLLGRHYYKQIRLDSLQLCLTAVEAMLDSSAAYAHYQGEVSILKAEALLYKKNHEQGLDAIDLAIGLAKYAPVDTIQLSQCYALRAQLLRKLNRRREARQATESLLALSKNLARHPKAMLDAYEGLALQAMHDTDTTLFFDVLKRMRQQFDHFPNGQQHPDCLLAYYYYKRGKYEPSMRLYKALLKQYQAVRSSNTSFYDEAYFVLCEMHRSQSAFDSAFHYNYLSINNLVGDRPDIMEAITGGNYSKIDPEYRHSLTIFLSKIPAIRFEAYHKAPEQPTLLEQTVTEWLALDSLFFIHSRIKDEGALLAFAGELFDDIYQLAVESCMEAYQQLENTKYLEHAHFFIERVKYAGMARSIMRQKYRRALPDTLAEEWQQTETSLKHLHRQKFEHLEAEDQDLNEQISRLNKKQRMLLQQLHIEHPQLRPEAFDLGIPTLDQLQQKIDRPVLQYYMTDHEIHCLIIQPDRIQALSWPYAAGLDTIAIQYHKLLSVLNNAYRPEKYRLYLRLGQTLYENLIQPVTPYLEQEENIVICPDANFPTLAYGSLPSGPVITKTSSYLNIPYLIRSHNITYTHSLKTLDLNYQAVCRTFLGETRILAYAFSGEEVRTPIGRWLQRNASTTALPGSVTDLAAIEAGFQGRESGSIFRYGNQASLHNFLRDVQEPFHIIHLSLHATSDLDNRWNNQIHFPRSTQHLTDTIFGADLEQFSLAQSLVVLSSCETATGSNMRAEGVYSLARSCFTAGADAVIASLWKIEDKASSQVINRFYHHLSTGLNANQSLHHAKKDYLETTADNYLAFPGLWAGLVAFN